MLRKFVSGFIVVILLLTVSSCDDDDDAAPAKNITNFSGSMSGANEVPAVTTTATGNVTAEFDNDTKVLTLTITYSGLSGPVTVWHVHKEATGVAGAPVPGLNYGTLGASPFTWVSTPLDAAMEADLMSNLWYVNIHTDLNKGGEIRGQLNKQ